MCALLSWGGTQRVQRIILSENSNKQFDFSRIVRHLEAAGQEVELLVFDGKHRKREAVDMHAVPADRVIVTGAPWFDDFFAMRPSACLRRSFGNAGLNPDRPLLPYLCSSKFVAAREADFVRGWIDAVRGCRGRSRRPDESASSRGARRCGTIRHGACCSRWSRREHAARVFYLQEHLLCPCKMHEVIVREAAEREIPVGDARDAPEYREHHGNTSAMLGWLTGRSH
jgi:hypothetical protein